MPRKTQTPTDDSGFSFENLSVEDSTLPERVQRAEKPNPLQPAVQASLDEGKGKKLPPIPHANVKEADNYLRRAAVKLGCGITIRPVNNGDGTVTVYFQALAEKRRRTYTVDDVRAWAIAQGWTEEQLYPRVPADISNQYREAHGLKVNKPSE